MIQLPPQSLSASLLQLQRDAGVNIIASNDVITGRKALAVSGKLTAKDALGAMLEGSGLEAQQLDGKTFVIKVAPPKAPKPAPERDDSGPIASVTITGEAQGNGSFVERASRSALRTERSLAETPMAVKVINEEFINSIQAQSVGDTLAYFSGTAMSRAANGSPQATVRGSYANTKTNGISDVGPINSLQLPMAGVERVEVVKGAASILSGAMAPGGMVNVQLKQPTAKSVREVSGQVGSYGNVLASLDLGGVAGTDDRLTYRMVLSGERADESSGGYDGKKARYFAPALAWRDGGTEATLGYRHQYQRQPMVPSTIVDVQGPVRFTGRATPLGNLASTDDSVTLDFTQKLSDIFTFDSTTQYLESTRTQEPTYMLLGGMDGIGYFQSISYRNRSYSISTDNHVKASGKIGAAKHTLLAGFSYSRNSTLDYSSRFSLVLEPFPMPTAPAVAGPSDVPDHNIDRFRTKYLQYQFDWDRWHVLAGIAHGTYKSVIAGDASSTSKWTPSAGVVYQVTDKVGVYVNALKSYKPGNGFLEDGTPAPPESGKSFELGVKADLARDKLTLTANIFQSTQDHALVVDPVTFRTSIGEAFTFRGAEFDITGKPYPGLNVSLSYAFTRITDGVSVDPEALPKHAGSLWLTYDLQSEALRGWGGGFGLQTRNNYTTYTLLGGRAQIPGHVKADLTAYYHARAWSLTLGVKNVGGNLMYEEGGNARVNLMPGRLAYLTGRYNF